MALEEVYKKLFQSYIFLLGLSGGVREAGVWGWDLEGPPVRALGERAHVRTQVPTPTRARLTQ